MEWQPGVMLDRIDVDGDLIRFQLHSLAFAGRVSGRTLARGGMASIFKAIDSESGAAVVLKIPYLQYESDVVFFERFRREEEIIAGLASLVRLSQRAVATRGPPSARSR